MRADKGSDKEGTCRLTSRSSRPCGLSCGAPQARSNILRLRRAPTAGARRLNAGVSRHVRRLSPLRAYWADIPAGRLGSGSCCNCYRASYRGPKQSAPASAITCNSSIPAQIGPECGAQFAV